MLVVTDEKVLAIFVATVAKALDGLILQPFSFIPEPAILQLIGPDVLGEIVGRKAGRPCLEHQDFHSLFGQLFGHPATAGAGSDHDYVVKFRRHCARKSRVYHR